MASFADIKARSRQSLHKFMGRPAYVFTSAVPDAPVSVSVRAHSNAALAGDLAGTNLSYAETAERPPTLIFWNLQLTAQSYVLTRGHRVVLSPTEGYFIESVQPPDGLTTTCSVSEMAATELSDFPAPAADAPAVDLVSPEDIPSAPGWDTEEW